MAARLIVHGHFYQPPRENPWTGEVDEQPSAAPFRDWNERVHAECYRPNAYVEIPTAEGQLIVNNFARISFNAGPTLMSWLQRAHPSTYGRIIEGDRHSAERLGHGNAMAQAYHHTILPLSSARDIRTQVRWGLADFRHRFGREAQGMWLPETAVNDDVLAVLIEEGVRFTILAPGQAGEVLRPEAGWISCDEEAVDSRVAYKFMHPDGSGRSMSLFFYDGQIAHAIAFENLSSSAERFVEAFLSRGDSPQHVVHVATDGETYGHHFRFADLGLAYALFVEAERRQAEVTNYSAYLAAHPPEAEVRLRTGKGTAWSCAHGVGRWERDCGCSTAGAPGWNQRWRAPLRRAMDMVRVAADDIFEKLAGELVGDPWGVRDRYIDVVSNANGMDDFACSEAGRVLSGREIERVQTLLELQRNSMSMFTSCGWFFSDIGGIETMQVMRYAARTMELLRSLGGPDLEAAYTTILGKAKSNEPGVGTGADVYRRVVATTPRE